MQVTKVCITISRLPGVGGVEPREFDDFEFSRLSMFDEELVLLHTVQTHKN